jgi:hypothetical protein
MGYLPIQMEVRSNGCLYGCNYHPRNRRRVCGLLPDAAREKVSGKGSSQLAAAKIQADQHHNEGQHHRWGLDGDPSNVIMAAFIWLDRHFRIPLSHPRLSSSKMSLDPLHSPSDPAPARATDVADHFTPQRGHLIQSILSSTGTERIA